MQKAWVLSKEQRAEIKRLRREQRLGAEELGQRYGVHRTAILYHVKGMPVQRTMTPYRTQILKMRLMKINDTQIALELGFHRASVGRFVRKATPEDWFAAKCSLYEDIRKAYADGDPIRNICAWSRMEHNRVKQILNGAQPRMERKAA